MGGGRGTASTDTTPRKWGVDRITERAASVIGRGLKGIERGGQLE